MSSSEDETGVKLNYYYSISAIKLRSSTNKGLTDLNTKYSKGPFNYYVTL